MTYDQISDGGSYVLIAKGLLKYGFHSRGEDDGKLFLAGGFLYPIILSVNIYLSNNLLPIILLQLILDSLIPIMIYLMAFKVFKNKKVGIVASISYMLYYPNFVHIRTIGADAFYIFLLTFSIFWYIYHYDNLRIRDYIIIGFLFSLTSLQRAPVFYPFLLTVIIFIIYNLIKSKKTALKLLLILLIFAIIQIPILFMSYYHSGKFTLGSTAGGIMICYGTYIPSNGDNDEIYLKAFPEHPKNIVDKNEKIYNWNQTQKDSAYIALAKQQVIENITKNPSGTLKVMLYQFSRFWFNFPYYNPASFGTKLIAVINSFILIIAILGVVNLFKNKSKFIYPLITGLLFYQLLHLFVFNQIRYSAPLMPVILFLFSMGLYFIFERFIKKNKEATT